jgi:hypothetical protein
MAVTTGRGRGRSLRAWLSTSSESSHRFRIADMTGRISHTHDPNQVGLQRSRQPDCRTRDGHRSHHMPYILGVLRLARSTRAGRYHRSTITTMTFIPR